MALPEYKAWAQATIRESLNQGINDTIPQIERNRAIFKNDAAALAHGADVIDAFDAAYVTYAAEVDACESEEEVDTVLGSVTYPSV